MRTLLEARGDRRVPRLIDCKETKFFMQKVFFWNHLLLNA